MRRLEIELIILSQNTNFLTLLSAVFREQIPNDLIIELQKQRECVLEREREKEREKKRERERGLV